MFNPIVSLNPSLLGGAFALLGSVDPKTLEKMQPEMPQVLDAITRSFKYMPGHVAAQVKAFLTPANLGVMAATMAGWLVAHLFGIGFVLDLILAGLAVAVLGVTGMEGVLKLLEFNHKAHRARSEAELEDAAKLFAEAVLILGTTAVSALFLRRPLGASHRKELERHVLQRAATRRTFSAAPSQQLETLRNRVVPYPSHHRSKLLGPGGAVRGRGLNATADNVVVLPDDWDGAFLVAIHAMAKATRFDTGAKLMTGQQLAHAMGRNGYSGGDVVLFACEAGLNPKLVKDFWVALAGLKLDKPVGTIFAPRRAIVGTETFGKNPFHGDWTRWEEFHPSEFQLYPAR